MSQRIFFVDEDNVTFVNYGSGSDYTYRREARIHNALRGLHRTRGATGRASQRQNQPLTRRRQPSASTPSVNLGNPISGVARDLLAYDFNGQPQAIESLWRSAFQDYFFLPQLNAPVANLPSPDDMFLAAARASPYAYRNLVTLTVVTSEARRGALMSGPVFRNQAQHIQEYRTLVDHYNSRPDGCVTCQEFQDLFTAGFAFFGRDFGREPAYNAIMYVNATLMSSPVTWSAKQLPTAEWIRMLLPRPGNTFVRTPQYECLMRQKVNCLLEFMEGAQNAALAIPTAAAAATPVPFFRPESAIYKVVTSNLEDSNTPEPFPGFYQTCLHRILFMLHTYMNELGQEDQPLTPTDEFLGTLESAASACLAYEPRRRTALFLWAVLVQASAQAKCRDPREQYYTWAMKELHALYALDFVPAMASWLFRRGGHGVGTPLVVLDFAALRSTLSDHYGSD